MFNKTCYLYGRPFSQVRDLFKNLPTIRSYMYVYTTGVHSSNTGKLWNYTGNQNLSSPRGGCRATILTCFRHSDPVRKKKTRVNGLLHVRALVGAYMCMCGQLQNVTAEQRCEVRSVLAYSWRRIRGDEHTHSCTFR